MGKIQEILKNFKIQSTSSELRKIEDIIQAISDAGTLTTSYMNMQAKDPTIKRIAKDVEKSLADARRKIEGARNILIKGENVK